MSSTLLVGMLDSAVVSGIRAPTIFRASQLLMDTVLLLELS